jgi:hypothetical protein
MTDVSRFTGNNSAVDVLTEQMNDMLNNGLLQGKDYSYTKKKETDREATFDVLLYEDDPSKPTHGYEFALSRQTAPDDHETLQIYKPPNESRYWRTDHVLPLSESEVTLQMKHNDMMKTRQKSFRKACFGKSYEDPSVQHSFGVDNTHNLCCNLGKDAKTYADKSGNPIGSAARKIGSDNWSTCMGSNVCTFYAKKFHDGTKPLFATSPDLYKATTYIPSDMNCEAYVAAKLSSDAHGTPGIDTNGDPQKCPFEERTNIDKNIHSQHKDIQLIIDKLLKTIA